MASVLITGGTGLVGTQLCRLLEEKGYEVALLGRMNDPGATYPTYVWDWKKMEIEEQAFDRADYIIHLAGANLADKRWTTSRKRIIQDSRIRTIQLIYNTLKHRHQKIKALISASAIGYYGSVSSPGIYSENDPPAEDFLGNTCEKLEHEVESFKSLGIRTVRIRTGVVLTRKGGALSRMAYPLKFGMGPIFGSGEQYLPWIHAVDLCNIYLRALEDMEMEGAYNAVAPDHKTNRQFMHAIALARKRPVIFVRIPSLALNFILGQRADMILFGSRVSSEKIIKAGYRFLYPVLESALIDLIG